ncbi:MAG TPA: heavy-metal-associated domain-containing protein [Sphingobacteriaceae bacterium]
MRVFLVTMFTFFTTAAFAQSDSTSFKVSGNCGMCKKRIEGAVKGAAVSEANWNVETKMMSVKFDPAKITAEQLQKKVAAVGHDTEKFTAEKAVYDKLPGCCLYDRKGGGKR